MNFIYFMRNTIMAEILNENNVNEQTMPTQEMETQISVKIPENAMEKQNLMDKLMEFLEKIITQITSKASYTKKEIDKLKEQTANIERAVKSNEMSIDSLAEVTTYLAEGSMCADRNDPTKVMDFVGKAELISITPKMEDLLNGNHEMFKFNKDKLEERYPDVAKQFEGQDIYFSPDAKMSLFTIKENDNGEKVVGSVFYDLEQFREKIGVRNFGLNKADGMLEPVSEKEVNEICRRGWNTRFKERDEITDKQIIKREMEAKVSEAKLQEVSDFLKQNMPAGTNITINKNLSMVYVENPELPDARLAIMMCTDRHGVERISSIRLVDQENFKDFNLEEMTKSDKMNFIDNAKALAYVGSSLQDGGKVETVDSKTGVYTMQDTLVMNDSLEGSAKDMVSELAVYVKQASMDMSIVNEVVEERQDDKEYAEEQQNDEKEAENDREEKF